MEFWDAAKTRSTAHVGWSLTKAAYAHSVGNFCPTALYAALASCVQTGRFARGIDTNSLSFGRRSTAARPANHARYISTVELQIPKLVSKVSGLQY